MVVIRKNISREKGETRLIDEIRYFFYITNDRKASAAIIVFGCNDRCNQENLIALFASLRALHAPVDNLTSNKAYMLMTSLAWTLKAWAALATPETDRQKSSNSRVEQPAHPPPYTKTRNQQIEVSQSEELTA